ncbi:MAG: diiron oxygenase [Archangium sp.]
MTLHLGAADEGLATVQRRFFDEALPAELHLGAFEQFDARTYDADTISWARESWELRTLDEYRSQVGFTEFLMELTELGCAFDTITAAVRVVRDEARHVELCRRLVNALGGTDEIPGEPKWVRSDERESLKVRVLQTLTGSLCIGETLSTALLAATRDVTVDPLAKEVVTALTRDESFHSQLGWTLLEQLWPAANAKERKRVERRIKLDLESAHEAVFENCDADDSGDPRNPFGHLMNAERLEVYERSLKRDVLRRFQKLRIKT